MTLKELEQLANMGYTTRLRSTARWAADEITTLRAEVERLMRERDEAQQQLANIARAALGDK